MKRTIIIVLTIMGLHLFGLFNSVVYADSGTGADSSGVCTSSCGDAEWWGVYPDSDGTSGISWKMFKTKNEYYKKYQLFKTSYEKGPVYCKDREKQENENCTGSDTIGGLRGGGYDKKLATKCSKAGYDWYIVLAFDGWHEKDKSKVRYFGPSAVGATYTNYHGGQSLLYRNDTIQTKNQLSKKATLAALENGTLAEGSRVDRTVAKYFCQMDKTSSLCANYNGGTLPKGLGYVCVGDSEWQGQSIASRTKGGAAIATAGYSDDTKTGKGYINNCDPVKGCNVYCTHNIKRTAGSGTTSYKVTRTSNMTKSDDKNRGIDDNNNVKSGSSNSDGSAKQASTSGPFKLYPGMRLCERITFKSHGAANSPNVYTEVCVYALGDAQPGDPGQPNNPGGTPDDKEDPNKNSGDTSFINIKVRNSSVTKKYNEYQRLVYAKPNDVLMYRATYWPNLQYTYNLRPSQIQIITSKSNGSPINNTNSKLGELFNAKRGSLATWKNGFTIERKRMESDNNDYKDAYHVGDYNYGVGETDKKRPTPHSVTVGMNDVGRSVNERAITSFNGINTNQTTPGQVTFVPDNLGKIDTRSRYQVAKARVPYNFEIKAEIKNKINNENNPDPDVVFAGEETTVTYNIDINGRKNCLTTNNCSEEEAYATKVKDARRELVIYDPAVVPEKSGGVVSGNRSADICQSYFGHVADKINCGYSADKTESLNPGSNPMTNSFLNQDKSAGSRVCVAVAVFPANSGAESNWNNTQYSGTWRISDSKCFTIAKRPSFQVWGGNIYSRGKVTTATSTKYNLNGYGEYKIEGTVNPHVFGSFGELGLIASGSVKGLGSGAATGYASIDANGVLSPNPFVSNTSDNTPNPGGGTKSSICDRSPLTFSNTPCSSETVGELGKTATTSNAENDKTRVLEKLVRELDEGRHAATSPVTLNNPEYKQSSGIYYYYNNDNLEIGDGTHLNDNNPISIDNSTVQVVHSENTVLVKDNIAYNGTYNKYSDFPKLVIYGKNVVIDCNVTRIDALIVADEKVVACNNYDKDINTTSDGDFKNNIISHINEPANSKQLKVNGAIIAKTLIANRTYGAATGANSIIPAEIINFDPTLYMWGNLGDDDSDDNGELEVTLTKELAPRR